MDNKWRWQSEEGGAERMVIDHCRLRRTSTCEQQQQQDNPINVGHESGVLHSRLSCFERSQLDAFEGIRNFTAASATTAAAWCGNLACEWHSKHTALAVGHAGISISAQWDLHGLWF